MQKRFAIGSSCGLKSSTWNIWTRKNDVYLLARSAGNSMHLSFHESGRCHTKSKGTFAKSVRQNRGQLHPYLDIWRLRYNAEMFAVAFRILAPYSQLRDVRREDKPVIWLNPPVEGATGEVTILFDKINRLDSDFMGEIFLRHELNNGQNLMLLYRTYRDTEGMLQQISETRYKIKSKQPFHIGNFSEIDLTMTRLIIFGTEPDGSRYAIDIAGDTLFSDSAA